ncbi:hypothetical protein COL922a_013685 [Colletotrichum nupharicola]|nr:hypothetical protein COL922a_013685 [Colletotrichum nupharicola]
MPVEIPDPGPEGVFNTLTRMYEKYPDTPFILKTSRPIVILPGNLVDDVKNMPEEKVSLHAEVKIDHSMAVTKVGGGTYGTELLPTVRIDLTRHTNGATPAILDELRFAMDIELNDVGSDKWSTKGLHMSVTKIEDVLQQDGFTMDDKGRRIMGRTSYVKLRKLDSFLKESMRLCPNKLVNMARIVQSPVTLSTGHTLSAGTRIGVPVYHVMTSPSTQQSYAEVADQAPASEFDGFRFYKLRQTDGNENKFHYITTTSDYLAWGLGTHSCPGRFFSSTAIKVLFVEMLRFWDFRLAGDVDRKGGPPVGHRLNDFTLTTDVTVPLEIKRREGAN